MSIAERVRIRRTEFGWTQAQLANRTGTSQQAIQQLENGETKRPRYLPELSVALKCSLQWLLTGGEGYPADKDRGIAVRKEEVNIRDTHLETELWENMTSHDKDEFVEIPLLKVSLAAGDGNYGVEESSNFSLIFHCYYLRKMGVHASTARLVRVTGRSMEPILNDGDVVAINTQDTTIQDGKTYALCQADLLRVKTLILTPNSVIIRSINREEYPDEVMTRDEFYNHVKILGKIFWSSHNWA